MGLALDHRTQHFWKVDPALLEIEAVEHGLVGRVLSQELAGYPADLVLNGTLGVAIGRRQATVNARGARSVAPVGQGEKGLMETGIEPGFEFLWQLTDRARF